MRKHEFNASVSKLIKYRPVKVTMKIRKVCEAGRCMMYGGQVFIGDFIKQNGDYIIIGEKKNETSLYYQQISTIEKYDNKEQGKKSDLHR